MIWRDLHEEVRTFEGKLRKELERADTMLVWWAAGHKDHTSYDLDAQLRRWSIRRLNAKRLAERQAEGRILI